MRLAFGRSVSACPRVRSVGIRHLLLVWALIAACGPATVVQVAGWAGMLARGLAERPAAEAVQRTFDGRHPCRMCTTAAALRDTDGPGRRAPAPELRTATVHLALPEPLAWRPPSHDDGSALPGWPIRARRPGVEPAPDDPVPRSRT